jgi:uncharacterized membrane protein YfcA
VTSPLTGTSVWPAGLSGLIGGYLGAHLQPRLHETALRLLLGALATVLGALYAVQVTALTAVAA